MEIIAQALLFLAELLAQARLLLPEFGSELCAAVLHLKHLTNLDLSLFLLIRMWDAFGPFDRLIQRFHLPYPEPADQLFRFRKRPVRHCELAFGHLDSRAL